MASIKVLCMCMCVLILHFSAYVQKSHVLWRSSSFAAQVIRLFSANIYDSYIRSVLVTVSSLMYSWERWISCHGVFDSVILDFTLDGHRSTIGVHDGHRLHSGSYWYQMLFTFRSWYGCLCALPNFSFLAGLFLIYSFIQEEMMTGRNIIWFFSTNNFLILFILHMFRYTLFNRSIAKHTRAYKRQIIIITVNIIIYTVEQIQLLISPAKNKKAIRSTSSEQTRTSCT